MANQEQEREFAQGVFVSKQTFGKGKGEIIKQSFNWEEFKAWAEANVNDRGYLNIDIKTAKSDKNKLYAELNTWTPAAEKESPEENDGEEDGGDLPF